MKKQRDWYAPRWTHQQLEFDLSKGAIHAKEAIYHASNLLKSNLTSVAFMDFTQFMRRVLPQVDWDDARTVHTGTGLYWNNIDDMLEYVDFCTGHLLEVASWWKNHINNDDAAFTKAAEEKAKTIEQAAEKARAQANPESPEHIARGTRTDLVSGVKAKGGNSSEYALRRLARERPDLLERVESGELTVNQAAIEAGHRKTKTPLDQVMALLPKLSHDDREVLVAALSK